jgi:hypothetical protein
MADLRVGGQRKEAEGLGAGVGDDAHEVGVGPDQAEDDAPGRLAVGLAETVAAGVGDEL